MSCGNLILIVSDPYNKISLSQTSIFLNYHKITHSQTNIKIIFNNSILKSSEPIKTDGRRHFVLGELQDEMKTLSEYNASVDLTGSLAIALACI